MSKDISKPWRDHTVDERLVAIGRLVVPSNGVTIMDKVLRRALTAHRTRREGQIAMVFGDTRVGKTTGAEAFMYKYANESGGAFVSVDTAQKGLIEVAAASYVTIKRDGKVVKPIIRIEVAPRPTFNGLLDDTILAITGRRPPRWATFVQLMGIVANQLLGQEIMVLIFDDAQHVAETRTENGKFHASEVFKVLAKVTGAEVVLMGMPNMVSLVDVNPQLKEMVQQRAEVTPFEWPVNVKSEFVIFLKKFSRHLPFDEASEIADIDTACRLHAYSGGHIGRLSLLFQSAIQYAVENKIEKLDQKTLGLALEEWKGLSGSRNALLRTSRPRPPKVLDADQEADDESLGALT